MIKEIIFRAAIRTKISVTLIANQYIKTPPSEFLRSIQVSTGFDVADNEIVKRMNAGDLVITNDIPLADAVIAKGVTALSPRGESFTKENIKSRLSVRDFMETLRNSGVQTDGPAAISQQDRKTFAEHLDKWLLIKSKQG